jgi:Domain of unknown function (DUF6438)
MRVMYATYQGRRVAYMLSTALRFISTIGLFCLPTIAAAQQPIPDDLVISLQRGNCEGGCPVYRVLIFANGDVIWQGRGRVAKPGVALSAVERDQIRALIRDFESIDYFHLDDIYGFRGNGCRSTTLGMPMAITSLSMGGVSKTLSHHDGCVGEVSDKLMALENNIDKVVNTARWITGEPPARK